MTTRTEIRARAYTEAARLDADARKYEAGQETIRTGITAAMIPWVALIIMGGIVSAIVVWWQGKIWHTRARGEGRGETRYLPLAPRWQTSCCSPSVRAIKSRSKATPPTS